MEKTQDEKNYVMNNNWFKLIIKGTKVKYYKNLLLNVVLGFFNKGGEELTIGDNTAIGGNINVDYAKEIVIGRNCFIGCNSIIQKGTVLGDGCVV